MFNCTQIAFLGNVSDLFHIAPDRPSLQVTFSGIVARPFVLKKAFPYPMNIIDLYIFFLSTKKYIYIYIHTHVSTDVHVV